MTATIHLEHLLNLQPTGDFGDTNRAWLAPDGTWIPTNLHQNARHYVADGHEAFGYALFDHGCVRVWCYPGKELGVQTPNPLTRDQFAAIHALIKAARPGWLITDRGRYDTGSEARLTTCERDEQGEREWPERYRLFRAALGMLAT